MTQHSNFRSESGQNGAQEHPVNRRRQLCGIRPPRPIKTGRSKGAVLPAASVSLNTMPLDAYPRRIASLSDEATEWIYLLGEQDRIVGVSGFSTRPPEVRFKPKISTFRDADFEAIARLDPDLIITYSDVQAEITRQASLRGFPVLN